MTQKELTEKIKNYFLENPCLWQRISEDEIEIDGSFLASDLAEFILVF